MLRENEKKCNAKGKKISQKENKNLDKDIKRIPFNQQEKLYIFKSRGKM